jgi:hypothetical protein
MPSPLRIGVESAVVCALVIGLLLVGGAVEPVGLLFPGARSESPEVFEQDFGDPLPDRYGYDGQDMYLIARSFPDVARASDLGVSELRLRRMFQPATAAIAPPGVPTLALMVTANLIGIGLAAGALADLAKRYGRHPRAGYAAAVALAFPLVITTTEPLAFGLGFLGLALVERQRLVLATASFGLAGLTRETALVMAIAAGIVLVLRRRPWSGLALVAVSCAPLAAWSMYVQTQVPSGTANSTKLLGLLDANPSGADAVACAVAVSLMAVGAWRWRREPLLGLTALGFLGCCALYVGDSFHAEGLLRVSAAGVAVGLAALITWRDVTAQPVSGEVSA